MDATNLVQDEFVTHLAGTRAALPARVIGGRSDRAAVLGEHPADRHDSEPVPVGLDERGHHGSRGSSSRAKKDDAASRISLARFSSRTSACSVSIDAASALVVPARRPSSILTRRTHPRNVHDPDLRRDPLHGRVQEQRRVLTHRLRDQPLRPITQLIRVLPRCWHNSTFPWNQTVHQTRGDSVSRVMVAAVRPASEPRNRSNAGPKSSEDSPCRYSSGSTSVILGDLRHHGAKIAEENRLRSRGLIAALVVDPRRDHLDRT